jgi:hypothetical protein
MLFFLMKRTPEDILWKVVACPSNACGFTEARAGKVRTRMSRMRNFKTTGLLSSGSVI